MLSFITYIDEPDQVEIVADESGIDELISYLEDIKNDKDHMHLILGNELDPYPIGALCKGKTFFANHVRLEFSEKDAWKEESI